MFKTLCKQKFSNYLKQRTVDIIGVSSKAGQTVDGTQDAPQVMRQAGLHQIITNQNWQINDHGDIVDFIPQIDLNVDKQDYLHINNAYVMGQISQKLSERTYNSCKNGNFPLVLGGDHSIATGSIAGILKNYSDLKIIWVDAHADINTPLSSPSGNYHGMPVAHLMNLFPGNVHGFEWFDKIGPFVKKENITYIGLRDIDEIERKILNESGVQYYDMFDVEEQGIKNIMTNILQKYKDYPIHISFDIDGVDPQFAPGTGTRVRGGLNWRESHHIVKRIEKSQQLVSMDIVELNPKMDQIKEDFTGDVIKQNIGKTCYLCLDLIQSALGNKFT